MKNIMKRILIITLSIIFYQTAVAQISINSDGASPDASAMLDVTSTSQRHSHTKNDHFRAHSD